MDKKVEHMVQRLELLELFIAHQCALLAIDYPIENLVRGIVVKGSTNVVRVL
jgi:hypothetical protein